MAENVEDRVAAIGRELALLADEMRRVRGVYESQLEGQEEALRQGGEEIARLRARIAELEKPPAPPPAGKVEWAALWEQGPNAYGLRIQAKGVQISAPSAPGRVTIGEWAGRRGVKLTTLVGDNNVHNSGEMERTDLIQANAGGAPDPIFGEGAEFWMQASILFPDDFQFPTWQNYNLLGFHHTGTTGSGNFRVGFERGAGLPASAPGALVFRGHGGGSGQTQFVQPLGAPLARNVWINLIFHVKWSASAGFLDAWANGARRVSHRGPTLYVGQGCYLKLGNYHTPVCDPYPACIGQHKASSVVYGPIRRASALDILGYRLDGANLVAA